MGLPPIGPEHGGADLDAEMFREAERETEAKAERYAELHAGDPPRGSFLNAVRRALRRQRVRETRPRKPTP